MTPTPPPKPEGVVFDMDGLLLDTERLVRMAFFRACESLQLQVDESTYDACVGTNAVATQRILETHFGEGFDHGILQAEWHAVYRTLEPELTTKPGAQELLATLQNLDIPVALATSTRRPHAFANLERFGLDRYFDISVCGGETERGKPHPDPYLRACELLRLPAAVCWAVEDSDNGVRSAHGAGCNVIQVPDLVAPSAEVRRLGHTIYQSLDDVHALVVRR